MSRRKPVPEVEVHPEELMKIAPVSVGGVHWTGVFATRWWFCGTNTSGRYICALSPKGSDDETHAHKWVEEHLVRIRQWLRDNPEPEDIKRRAPVDRLFPRERRLWQAVLATWNREQVEMATATYGPLGCFNDDVPGSPFTKERCEQIFIEEATRRYGSGGAQVAEKGSERTQHAVEGCADGARPAKNSHDRAEHGAAQEGAAE